MRASGSDFSTRQCTKKGYIRLSAADRRIDGVSLFALDVHSDNRGSLIALEKAQGLPFNLVRAFFIYDVPSGEIRAEHAVSAHSFLVAINGRFTVECNNGIETVTVVLDRRDRGLHVMPGVMIKLSDFAPQSVALVASSETYANTVYFDAPTFERGGVG
jgi:dTDP-4-dehydrorhamnose 3,5-epimerase-like enzyme